jgi:hypothetical protein
MPQVLFRNGGMASGIRQKTRVVKEPEGLRGPSFPVIVDLADPFC